MILLTNTNHCLKLQKSLRNTQYVPELFGVNHEHKLIFMHYIDGISLYNALLDCDNSQFAQLKVAMKWLGTEMCRMEPALIAVAQ